MNHRDVNCGPSSSWTLFLGWHIRHHSDKIRDMYRAWFSNIDYLRGRKIIERSKDIEFQNDEFDVYFCRKWWIK